MIVFITGELKALAREYPRTFAGFVIAVAVLLSLLW